MNPEIKNNQSIFLANIVTYLHSVNEENIMKKVLLDICFKEINNGISIFSLEKGDILLEKIKSIMIN